MNQHIILDIQSLSQWFGPNRVLHDVDLKVMQGQFVAIVGGSGCGKSTLLKCILGTDKPKLGAVYLDGQKIEGPTRHVGMVYQKYGLYDFLTAEENVAFGLKLDESSIPQRLFRRSWWKKLRDSHLHQARALLVRLQLENAISEYPTRLSGGMQQRVAIAQALVMKPKVLLMDEPFGALDEVNRQKLQRMLLILYQENMAALERNQQPPHTVIMVTHELSEAFYVCDRVIGLGKDWTDSVDGRELSGRTLGATKLYDKAAPIYQPEDARNFDLFLDLIGDLRRVVIDPENPQQNRNDHVSFWSDLERGVGTGVVMHRWNGVQND